MSAKSEYDAAYFTLLRAIEERDDLLRYRDWLVEERERLDAFSDVTRDRTDGLARKLRRPIDHSTKPLPEAVGRRRAIVLDEQRRMDDRITAAEAFVLECEAEVETLRG
jgi:hypothetical protein